MLSLTPFQLDYSWITVESNSRALRTAQILLKNRYRTLQITCKPVPICLKAGETPEW